MPKPKDPHLTELARLGRKYRTLKATLEQITNDMTTAVQEATAAGHTPTVIARESTWSVPMVYVARRGKSSAPGGPVDDGPSR